MVNTIGVDPVGFLASLSVTMCLCANIIHFVAHGLSEALLSLSMTAAGAPLVFTYGRVADLIADRTGFAVEPAALAVAGWLGIRIMVI
jgi:hypothetical protein